MIGSTNAMINGICFNLEKNTKLYTDQLLDDINISDDENQNTAKNTNPNSKNDLTEKEYNMQMEKINEFYDEFADGSMNRYTGTRNELEERINIPVPFEVDEKTEFTEAGLIESIFETDKILLKPNLINGILDLDNIMWNNNHIAIGYLDDVLGKIDEPVYVVKIFPNLIDKNLVIQSEKLYYVKDRAHKIQKKELLKKRGCDASNAFDEEVGDSDIEFSDDEQEYNYKQVKRYFNLFFMMIIFFNLKYLFVLIYIR